MEQDKMWDWLQLERPELFRVSRSRQAYLVKRLGTGTDVLNIGIGEGYLERLAIEAGVQIACVDPSAAAVEKLREALGLGERAKVGSIQDIPFADSSFNHVVLSEVLEHLDDATIDAGLSEILRILRPGGSLIGTTPADENLSLSLVMCPDCGKQFHRWGHVQSFSRERLSDLLSKRFSVEELSRKMFGSGLSLLSTGGCAELVKRAMSVLQIPVKDQVFFFRARK